MSVCIRSVLTFCVKVLRQIFLFAYIFASLHFRVVDMCSVLLKYDNRVVDIILLQLMVADV